MRKRSSAIGQILALPGTVNPSYVVAQRPSHASLVRNASLVRSASLCAALIQLLLSAHSSQIFTATAPALVDHSKLPHHNTDSPDSHPFGSSLGPKILDLVDLRPNEHH